MDNKPDRPPDGSGKVQAGVSFRDKVTGNKDPPLAREKIDFLKSKLVRFEWEEGDRLRPRCFVDETVMNSLAQPFHDALVVKLLGKHIGFKLMRDKLQAVWKPTGGFDVIDIGFDYFMVKFDREEDRNKALFDGPWLMFDHYLIVRPWSPDFVAEDSLVEKTLVWIWLPGLGVMYYDEAFLMAFASAVGRPIKIDFNTANVTRGKFARICVEIDLTLPVVGKIWLNNHWYKVEYEALHIICSSCGCYGHVSRNCHSKASSQTTTHIPTVPVDKDGDHVEVGGGGVSNVGGGEKPRGSTVVPNSVSGNSEPPGVNKGHDDANIDLVHAQVLVDVNSDFSVQLLDSHPQAITILINKGDKTWGFSTVYASPVPLARERLWVHFSQLRGMFSFPRLLAGDFNEILLPSKVRGGQFISSRAQKFSQQEELFWMQKSKEQWVKFGDRNYKFFHAQTVVRRKRNKIHGLFLDDGSWATDPEVLKVEVNRFFQKLFSVDTPVSPTKLQIDRMPSLGIEGASLLEGLITMEEVRRAVMSMGTFKAPGPDGFQPFFFKQYWEIVGVDLWRMVSEAFNNGGMTDSSILDTLLVLIPKVDNLVHLK
uniref:Transposon TX1 uncharacterized n=1 Tax=Cajanus cajan TaxID=3821 RepID=A0A151S7V8_CAJCA|nr:Transposon TX1 uncharacterized [Cajanus cajan]